MSSVVVDAVEHLVRGIVDNPDDVRVDMVTSRRGRTVEVHVHPDDLGKVIGRGGRTATALRTLVAGIGGRGIRVDVVDTDQDRKSTRLNSSHVEISYAVFCL